MHYSRLFQIFRPLFSPSLHFWVVRYDQKRFCTQNSMPQVVGAGFCVQNRLSPPVDERFGAQNSSRRLEIMILRAELLADGWS